MAVFLSVFCISASQVPPIVVKGVACFHTDTSPRMVGQGS